MAETRTMAPEAAQLVYPRERSLGMLTLILGVLAWLALIAGTFGSALIALAIGFVAYLFMQSTLIAYIKGNGVELSAEQFPDLYAHFAACCDRLQMARRPKAYVLNGNGGLNAFATRFLGEQFVILFSDVVDAMEQHPDGVRFYIGHELGHLRMKHLSGRLLRWPVLWLPLIGAAYSRARETTCDRHGLACCASGEGAARSLAALSAGSQRWKNIDLPAYLRQAAHASGFWMSFHELTAGYPWLTKRVARVLDDESAMPRRNPFAYLLAAIVPYAGPLGGGFGMLILVYILGIIAAVALPAYQNHVNQAALEPLVLQSQPARDALAAYYEKEMQIPESLDEVGVKPQLTEAATLAMNPDNMVLSVKTAHGELLFTPKANKAGKIIWICSNGEGLKPTQLPPSCRK